jgi:hypothetical protein
MVSKDKKVFTIVFEGDVTKLDFNPLLTKTIFGDVIAVQRGDALKEQPTEVSELHKTVEKYLQANIEAIDNALAMKATINRQGFIQYIEGIKERFELALKEVKEQALSKRQD